MPTYGRLGSSESRPSYGFAQQTGSSSGSNVVVIVSGSSGSNFEYFSAGETLQKNDFVYLGSDNKVYKASCSNFQSSFVIGASTTTGSLNEIIPVFVNQGKTINGFSNLVVGQRYFLSQSFGLINSQAPKNKGDSVFQVGIAQSQTELLFLCQYLVLR